MSSKITYSSLPSQIKRIAHESLGVGVLQSIFNYGIDYQILIKVSDGETVGFALYHFDEVDLGDDSVYVTGVIDAICVSAKYRGEGFGTKITIGTLRKMAARSVNRVELMMKVPNAEDRDCEPGYPIRGSETLLSNLGFRKIIAYENYFEESSKNSKYDCIFCGNTPDSCTGVLYAINDKN